MHDVISDPRLGHVREHLARAASLRDQGERLRTYREFERIWIGEHAAVLPLAYGDVMLWLRPWITGMWVNATEISMFAHAVVTRPDLAAVGRGGFEPPPNGL
jgi:ABC-type transport system substrate-binding protein